jgi:hypothetical protein
MSADEDFKTVFDKNYPIETRMPYQGAWPIDFWALEETAFTKNPELWWGHETACACGNEPAMSYREIYYCKKCSPI